eukprot:7040950-Prymnesium_polylepis.1
MDATAASAAAAAAASAAVAKAKEAAAREAAKAEMEGHFTEEQQEHLIRIEDAVRAALRTCDPDNELPRSDYSDISVEVLDKVYYVMTEEGRTELDAQDLEFIGSRVRELIMEFRAPMQCTQRRFAKLDRVVCNVGGDRRWAAGSVQSLDEDDESDPTGRTLIPYVVKIDPPNSRLVTVPIDDNDVVRAEVCFGRRAGALWFTRMCLPKAARKGSQRARRFCKGDRVACAVEDATGSHTDWAAGTVLTVDHVVESEEGVGGGVAPYAVKLDAGDDVVLVHQDEHWLIRDLELQAEGARTAPDGTRCLARIAKRKRDDGWEAVDHVYAAAPASHARVPCPMGGGLPLDRAVCMASPAAGLARCARIRRSPTATATNAAM